MHLQQAIFLLCVLGSSLSLQKTKYARKQPNIIYILSDDLGHSDVGFTNGFIETPNLNRLAREGKYLRYWLSLKLWILAIPSITTA